MNNATDRLSAYTEAYHSGIYTKDETVSAIIKLLADSSDFSVLWPSVPDWVQLAIWNFLKSYDESSVRYDFSSKSYVGFSPELSALKSWLIKVMEGQ
ncbi:hypothetical protein ACO0LD_30505 [Undibacterium sp. Ji83W]|uniref:hypothetical protein n=1 Tax=Undibacterium sp. Ji83W TaxID=3413043 RepID=UPI003BF2F894